MSKRKQTFAVTWKNSGKLRVLTTATTAAKAVKNARGMYRKGLAPVGMKAKLIIF